MGENKDIHLYCLSNGSENIFPNNTLTCFQSKIPFKIEWTKNGPYRWFVALDSVGFDPNFTAPFRPVQDFLPSIILVNYRTDLKEAKENILSTCAGLETMPTQCSTDKLDKFFALEKNKKYANSKIFEKIYYFQENINYTKRRFYLFLKNIENYSPVKIKYSKDTSTFEISNTDTNKTVEIFLHTSLQNNLSVQTFRVSGIGNSYKVQGVTGSTFGKERYLIYTINKAQSIRICIENVNVKVPEIVKVQCSFIREQIFNGDYVKDLVFFGPQKDNNNKYSYYQVEKKSFVQLSNTILDTLDFKLVDDKNKLLQLQEGTPTFVKLHFKKMSAERRSFYVRLSSNVKTDGYDNSLEKFAVKLPNTLVFNRDWKVAVTSILVPGRFCTFPTPCEVVFAFKHNSDLVVLKEYMPMRELTKEDILETFNEIFLKWQSRIGTVYEKLTSSDYEPTLEFKFEKEGYFILPEHVCRVIGYGSEDFINGRKRFEIKFKPNEDRCYLRMSTALNLNYYRPNYIMMYSNIVEPTPVNGELTNLIKVFQIFQNEKHTLYEFKHFEYTRLLNDIVDVIKIELRTHTGELVKFEKKSTTNVIVNLLFSNYDDE